MAGHGRGPAQGGGPARPGGRGRRGLGPAQRPAGDPGAGAARRGRRHLREPPQRDQRRRRAVPQGGQRRLPAWLVVAPWRPTGRSSALLRDGAVKAGLPEDAVALVEDTSHETAVAFMQLAALIDCLIPRGGPVADRVAASSTPPCPTCSTATGTATSTSTRQPTSPWRRASWSTPRPTAPGSATRPRRSWCTPAWPRTFLPRLAESPLRGRRAAGRRARSGPSLPDAGVADRGGLRHGVPGTGGGDRRWSTTSSDAIDHIARYSSGHSEAIVTADVGAADRFVAEVDAAAVLVNASTRFVDGEELGLGAEIGISTQKLHARGPMGLRELTSMKWVVRGDGQVRPSARPTARNRRRSLGLPEAGPTAVRRRSDDVRERPGRGRLPGRRGDRRRRLPGRPAGQAGAGRGPGRDGQDRAGQVGGRAHRERG